MPEIYTTIQGDTWDRIAKNLGWPETHLYHLMEANPDHQNVVLFSGGVELTVPEVPEPVEELSLPPWKRSQ